MLPITAPPTVPGIKAMFSSPERLWSTDQVTKSCQFWPAAVSIKTSVSVSLITLIPEKFILTTVPRKFLVNRMLAPPPRNKIGSSLGRSLGLFNSMKLLALAWTRRVL